LPGLTEASKAGLSTGMYATEPMAEAMVEEPVPIDGYPELFQIRGHLQTLIALRLIEPRHEQFFLALQKALARSPGFFRHAPVVLDAGPVAGQPPLNLAEFARRLRQQHLVPVGLQNGDETWNQMAINAGLAVVPAGRPVAVPAAEPTPETPQRPEQAPVRRNATVVVSEPVRAGQQVYAEGGDLIALAPVSPGAEVLADGHIHVYSHLRGRAHAGIDGDRGARIFCHSLEAQLVSIAGVYVVNEEIDPRFLGKRVQVRCADGEIVMEHLP
jgi:septum site-determining protein MinC